MNMKAIARHYETLTSWERLPLLVAAARRGDTPETERLGRSAPKVRYAVPDFFGLEDGLRLSSALLMMELLDLVAEYGRIARRLADLRTFFNEEEARPYEAKYRPCLKYRAFKFVTLLDVWRLACKELNLDDAFFIQPMPGFDTVMDSEREMLVMAFTTDEAGAFVIGQFTAQAVEAGRTDLKIEVKLCSVEEIAKDMKDGLAKKLAEWS